MDSRWRKDNLHINLGYCQAYLEFVDPLTLNSLYAYRLPIFSR